MIFEIICDSREYLEQAIVWYNESHKTDFKIIGYDIDEVNFAIIEVKNYKCSDLFGLGLQFGMITQRNAPVENKPLLRPKD